MQGSHRFVNRQCLENPGQNSGGFEKIYSFQAHLVNFFTEKSNLQNTLPIFRDMVYTTSGKRGAAGPQPDWAA
jgi:hypothetical protein